MKDFSGKTFGRLTVLKRSASNNEKLVCKCSCGVTKEIWQKHVVYGKTASCGCLLSETASARRTHGMSETSTYKTWGQMKVRCTDKSNPNFKDYGGRGITICQRWMSFENFLADMGERPAGMSIGRIKNSLGYYKNNCRWETATQQACNRRTNATFTFNGETKCISEFSRQYNIPQGVLWYRLNAGWPIEKALTQPIRKWPNA